MRKKISKWFQIITKKLMITISLDPNHPMVLIKDSLDWNHLISIAEKYRKKKIKNGAGRKPDLQTLTSAIIVRVLESCTLRKAMDLIRHYGPARYLCGLGLLKWTPNFRTISDFEIMLGADGLEEINNYILKIAMELGFINIKGLCADTTAQEANIPYPNEVGLMGSFAKTINSAIALLGRKLCSSKNTLLEKIETIKKLVRKHHLFCKTDKEKRKAEKKMLSTSNSICLEIKDVIKNMSKASIASLHGHQKSAYLRLQKMAKIFDKLSPQINYYIQNGTAIKGKIISLFQPLLHSIVRGKAGKKVEFGLKWGINQIRGGYISLFQLNGKAGEADYAVQGVKHHIELFGAAPEEYGYDRGGWSELHMKEIKDLGVKKIGIAPIGKLKWKVSKKDQKNIYKERAQVEGKIGTIKRYGFNKPNEKTENGMGRAAHRSEIRFNITRLIKDVLSKMASTKKKNKRKKIGKKTKGKAKKNKK